MTPFKFSFPTLPSPELLAQMRRELNPGDRKILIAGTSDAKELEEFLRVYGESWPETDRPLAIVVPRTQDAIDEGLTAGWFRPHRTVERDRTHREDGSREPLPDMRAHDVLLVKTRGELFQLFGLADLAVVGSDRNIFEPASLGKPILYFGDRKAWRNNRDALDALEKENGAMSFPRVRLRAVLDDSSRIQEMGASAARAYRQSKEQRIPEMTEKIVDCLLPFVLFRALYGMKEPLPQEAAPQDAIAPAVFGQAA